jgi:hypothetical protein
MAQFAGRLLRLGATLAALGALTGCVAFGDLAPPVTEIDQSVGPSDLPVTPTIQIVQ